MSNRNTTPEQIAKNIAYVALICCTHALLICSKKDYLRKVTKINFLLNICKESFFFIDNKNIDLGNLWEYGLHLQGTGKVKLARNVIYF